MQSRYKDAEQREIVAKQKALGIRDQHIKGKAHYAARDYGHVLAMLRELLQSKTNPKISEFGGGTGNFAVLLPHLIPGAQITMLDMHPKSCTIARNRGVNVREVDLHQHDFTQPAFREQADAVIANAFERGTDYSIDYEKIVEKLAQHIAPGAPVIFQFMSHEEARRFRDALHKGPFKIRKEYLGHGKALIAAVKRKSEES